MTVAAAITSATISDGDPAALAALCQLRGAAVLAYCKEVAGPEIAIAAAADALARFRAALVTPADLTGKQAEALLVRMTRRAATSSAIAALAHESLALECVEHQSRIADYCEEALSPDDRDNFDEHVASCHSCAAALQRLREGARAFSQAAGAPPPRGLSAVLLEAMVAAAPVLVHDGDQASVRAEGLRLLHDDGDGAAEAATPEPTIAPQAVTVTRDVDVQPARAPLRPQPPSPPANAPTDGRAERIKQRFRRRPAASAPGRFRATSLLRGTAKLLAVVLLAGAGGALLGIGLSKLTGDDTASAPLLTGTTAAPANDSPSTTTTATTTAPASTSTGDKLKVDVLSTTVRPVTSSTEAGNQTARINIRVRVTNSTGRLVAPQSPALQVGDTRLTVDNASSEDARPLLQELEAGAVAAGRLRFDVEGADSDELTTTRIQLQIVGKRIALTPVAGN